jgi:ribosome biogenesis GTPase
VGDWVLVDIFGDEGKAIIHSVLPRRTSFSRKVAGRRTKEQIIASNVDILCIVSGLDRGQNLRSLERYLTLGHESRSKPVLIFNKMDLYPEFSQVEDEMNRIAPNVPVIFMSAKNGAGVENLHSILTHGLTASFIGPSGAGKSSIINLLLGEKRLRTLEVRESDGKGRHSTTHRQLFLLPGGAMVIDSPGMRELALWGAGAGLEETFDDILGLSAACQFRDCQHDREPGCAVRAALESGELSAGRFESYLKLRKEIQHLQRRTSYTAAEEERRKWKRITKNMRKRRKELEG